MIVEVCANSVQSALNAERAGANRLEVCIELGVGGITPSFGMLKKLREIISIPMHVLIRPRSGDFTYSSTEFEVMLRDIAICRDMGFEGVVGGVLNPDSTLDTDRTERLYMASMEMQFTFHRAFDWVKDPLNTLKALEAIGLDNILTSGQASSAVKGLSLLKELNDKAEKINIIPAAGIRPHNAQLFKEAGFKVVHLSGVQMIRALSEAPKVGMNSRDLLNEEMIPVTDEDLIKELIKTVK